MTDAAAKVELRKSARARLNYTNLRHLSEVDVRLAVIDEAVPPTIRIEYLALDGRVSNSANVSVEAYRGSTGEYERFDFGPASAFKADPAFGPTRQFRRVDDTTGMNYRLKVTDETTGRLIAEIDRIKPQLNGPGENPREFIQVRYAPLGGEIWRVSVGDDGAFIEIEKSLKADGIYLWDEMKFRCLIYPAALRVVAERLLREDRFRETDWGRKAMSFLQHFAPAVGDLGKAPEPDELEQCIAQAARAFANRHDFVGKAKSAFSREAGSKS